MATKKSKKETRLQEGVRDAFSFLREAHRQPELFKGDLVVIPLKQLVEGHGDPLSKERLRLLLELRRNGPFDSVTDLALAVHRPRSRVSQDLEVLGRLNLISQDRSGRKRRVRTGPSKIVIPVG